MVFSIYGINRSLNLSDDWQAIKTMPEDPDKSVAIAKQTEYAQCFVLIFPIEKEKLMPFDNPSFVIDGIHHSLGNDQGLIEVNSSNESIPYIYSIVKTQQEPNGMQYFLRLQFDFNNNFYEINGFFNEIGMIGVRDTTVYELARRSGKVKKDFDDWFNDLYDSNFKKGILRNLAEDANFDASFPLHPLSEARNFIKIVMEELKN